ncbi:MAG: MMPL family transporter [Corynebacteriales bacterium]|nr:MMPL family transporter [Mycobacteriales bacterium]
MSALLHRIGAFSARRPWRMVALWLIAVVGIGGLAAVAGGVNNDNFDVPNSNSKVASDLLSEHFPAFSGADARVVVHDADREITAQALEKVGVELGDVHGVSTVAPPQFSEDKHTALIAVNYDIPVTDFKGTEGLDALEDATASLRDAGYQVEFGGQVPENVAMPSGLAEAIGIGAAVIILLFAFGSLLAAGIPIAIAVVGLATGLSGVMLLAAVTDVSTYSPTLGMMVGLGVGIDYALFIVTRFRQELLEGRQVDVAVARSNATAGLSVVFAGFTVLIALAGLLFTGLPTFTTMGFATGIVVLTTMLSAVTLLPAILRLLGMRLLPKKQRARRQAPSTSPTRVERFARQVTSKPWRWALGSLAILFVLIIPLFDMRTWPSDAGSEPTSNTVRQAYDLLEDGFGAGANGPLLVAVDLDKISAEELPALVSRLEDVDGVETASPAQLAPEQGAAVITVTPEYGPQDERIPDLVERVRDVAPPGSGVTGLTAVYHDLSEVLAKNLWKVIAIVVGSSLILLMMMFRSVVIPIKAALMNLLSIGAAYGVVVAVFQWGWGASLLGLPHSVPVSSFLPVLMFALLFGLSMDYEVFLLARIRERWLATGDAREAVTAGLSTTARVISSAALIMVTVFIGFALDPVVVIKMMGVGLATAVAVDATIVRLILVPAVMELLGEKNWWLPAWLDRILPNLDPHPEEPPAPQEAEKELVTTA